MRLAMWRAGRSGVRGDVVHPRTHTAAPAGEVVTTLVEHLAPALDRAGDLDTVIKLLGGVLERGNGARFQRAAYARAGDLRTVVTAAVRRTMAV
ncbi:hypothetical protein GCM10023178_72250 [Actinomadura luteofluorescens]